MACNRRLSLARVKDTGFSVTGDFNLLCDSGKYQVNGYMEP